MFLLFIFALFIGIVCAIVIKDRTASIASTIFLCAFWYVIYLEFFK